MPLFSTPPASSPEHLGNDSRFVVRLIDLFRELGCSVEGARGVSGLPLPPLITNDGFGLGKPRRPAVIGFDHHNHRIVFGVVRKEREDLDSEESLEEYNVFLDHNHALRERASLLYVAMPARLLLDFSALITHYIHREYWHRILPLPCDE